MKNSSSFTQQAATDHREIGGDLSILSGAAAAGQGGVGVGGRSWSWSQWNGRLKQQLVGQEQEARTAAAGRRSGWSKREQHVVVEQEQQRLPGAAMIATPVREGLERTAEALDERVRVGLGVGVGWERKGRKGFLMEILKTTGSNFKYRR
ncbi:hypothetical protein CDL15_Pgr016112 [Punica granatum]|uniref:Uncharacterized protein n=1 Tax=Punica granatum TaxID=22663 RepID=A0A218X0P6_PUNGR|nr:hypothetical protein CDL15_Pgr016112 [Punica granatum]